ncbi:unnamed protein product [Rotaria sordida]|uniref:RING-type E3 ubiquitin transferase n=1 Tax=Rotaria sordida TaxID=392033 RepID=A0A814C707_9BILA|nr:unnamed protein product [Rotaria sordida]CAF0903892.1 unnamed protein product [Rotaria sordida]CAF0940177.1 unnamed protein product [Rotaria sordida]CAF3710631.1 unnamed protein product [Rotaria sordida]CAF3751096.1 unnamed protein product [Rotaria sordida]
MSSHIGVSCDSCLKTNFPSRRYKCLQCDNYDLCGSCYDMNAESQNHIHTHPMQCILTKTAYELFYAGELISYRTIVSLTCPYCGLSGFISHTLLIHCLEKHSIMLSENKTSQVVMCPICVINPLEGYQSRFVSLADHIAREHDNGDLSINQIQKFENKKDDYDQNDDEDEGLPLYILAERLFTKEENHRQETARQRLAQTIVRNDCNSSTLNRNITSQRHTLSRQSTIRGSRGGLRGHFNNNYPYGTVSRTTTGSFRIPFDTTIENTILPSDPYAAILFSQDPLFDFDSPFSNLTNTPFFLTSSVSTHTSAVESTNNDRIIQKKSNLSNMKQKRFNPIQQQSTQPMILTEPSISNYQLWQQEFSSSFNNMNFLTDTHITTTENNKINDYSLKHPENDPRSLLGKNLKVDYGNKSTRIDSEQNHTLFLQSLLLSLMNINIDKEQ